MTTGLTDDVRRFIAANIHSVEELEILLLLRRHADRGWTGEAVAAELRTEPSSATLGLTDLAGRGLLAVDAAAAAAWRYAPPPEVDAVVAALDTAYAERRVSVIQTIFAKPSGRLQAFTDAFKLWKPK